MNPSLKRSLILTLGLMVASVILAPFGLGWVPFVVGLGILAYSLFRRGGIFHRSESGDNSEHKRQERPTDQEDRGFAARVRGQRRGMDEAERRRQASERTQREGDCGLTHDERTRFQDIVQDMNRDSQ